MSTKPNLIFIMPDQLRGDFLGCYGADFIETPHIDSLAERGARYERAYSTSPICVPARAALLTGRNAIKNGVTDNGQWLRPDLADCGIFFAYLIDTLNCWMIIRRQSYGTYRTGRCGL
jgi:arylsulfatase A-like enzyme